MVDDGTYDKVEFRTLEEVLLEQKTTAFLIIRNDSLLYESYFENYDGASLLTSHSVAKSFVSTLVGIAQDEGKLNLNDQVIAYIPELVGLEGFDQLRVRHLLNHTSGIGTSLMQLARLYYGKDCSRVYGKLKLEQPPGTRQYYGNANLQLLGVVLAKATGMSCAQYLEEKLWKPLGMESDAFWSLDRKDGVEKSFCCLNATARDYARLGRLYLKRGQWNGQQVLSEKWIAETLRQDTTEGSSWVYNRSWYLGLQQYQDFMAIGLYKQFIYVYPEKNMVIVRLGERTNRIESEKVQWPRLFRQLADML